MREILNNPFILGTLAVMGTGWVMFWVRDVPKKIIKWLGRNIVYTMEVTNESLVYEWVRAWLGAQNKKARFVEGRIVPDEPGQLSFDSKKRYAKFFLAPRGFCIIKYRGRRIATWVWRENLQFSQSYRESFTFQTMP